MGTRSSLRSLTLAEPRQSAAATTLGNSGSEAFSSRSSLLRLLGELSQPFKKDVVPFTFHRGQDERPEAVDSASLASDVADQPRCVRVDGNELELGAYVVDAMAMGLTVVC